MKTLHSVLSRKICVVLAILLLLVLAAVFIAPSVDMEPSALRAIRAAVLFFFAILLAARLLIQVCDHRLSFELSTLHDLEPLNSSPPSDQNLLTLNCVLLC
ncbi:MAG TPA: hypothetical protein VLK33_18695 [Terriglobales bacterium]|nr:hypothetical protein [Terriglobales bacterium]